MIKLRVINTMKRPRMLPLILTITGIIAIGICSVWLILQQTSHRIIEQGAWIDNEDVHIVEVPIGGTFYAHIRSYSGGADRFELWDPNGNLVATEVSRDKRNPLDRLADFIWGSRLINSVDFALWRPMEGVWQVRIFKDPARSGSVYDLIAEASSPYQLQVEVGETIFVGDEQHVPIVARFYNGNQLICDENLQIEVEIQVQWDDPPKSHMLQSDTNCLFTGSSGLLELRDQGFYVVANYGSVRRQLLFSK
jgi:hypothetical protein